MTNNKQQTAVDEILNSLNKCGLELSEEYLNKLKEKEKNQMIDFAQSYAVMHCMGDITKNAEQYYNETYGGNNDKQ
jgi:mannitol/fructose-specific phosphotransferase system IIA component